ncbi:G5 domain-containing protein [Actinomyces urinae]|uniref:G5 domain-containing protein n=1 Tax=Actinomyces urinae TaxID=1689268 RepID=UPI0009F807FF|nr:G5 domain-containing protein [Actinomyces urinae]
MSHPTTGVKRPLRSSLVTLSAVALIGSTLGVAPSFIAPQEAAAATVSGGIRDKSGAVEKDAQQASDLPAGSCVVESAEPEGSQAGFTWNTLEPSPTSADQKAWGLSLAFDSSKDRTFADWSFTNSGLLAAVLNAGSVPSADIGQTFLGDPVTAKADENLEITAARLQRNLNLLSELSEQKVKQYAEATADNPVRYAWHGQYTKDNPDGLRATQGPNAIVTAVVNPWPSENIECNPITVSWESFEKHVIVPGEETKVGKINIPAVQNGGTDDSMSRMIVEAYDGTGQFIGTTDAEASGGTQNLRIDDNGDIYFTWPEYRGTDLADDKNVHFAVLAKPRTVDQLQAAVENNNFGIGNAFESANSLTRYNTPNVIDSKAFSLDDTEYHNPQYDKTDASIISGVDSETGPLATQLQKVVFTQTPDLIKELAKKKPEGGFEATVELDEKYIYEGWTVEMDDDYNVTVTAPENPKPGTFARPKITVEYSNGSTDVLELLVVVDPNHTQVTDLVRPGLSKGRLNEEITAQVGTKSIMKGHRPVPPAKFEIDPATVPDGWTVNVDETGTVTAVADDTVPPGSIITPMVKATYPDQTTDEIEVQFQAIVDIKVPDYNTVTGQPSANVSLTPEIPERGLSGNTTDEAPVRYTFEDGTTQTTLTSKDGKTWTVFVDENTGEITTTIPKDAVEGDLLNVPVLAHYEKDFKPQPVVGTVVVIKGDLKASYDVQVTGPNEAVDHHVDGAPDGSTFSFGYTDGKPVLEQTTENGWKYTIDPKTGVVSSTPPANSKPGDKNTVSVKVNAPDGMTTEVPVTTVVKLTNSWESNPVVPPKTVYPNGTVTSPLTLEKPESISVAKENPYEIAPLPDHITPTGDTNEYGNPTYTLKTDNGDWIVSLDDKGNVISTAPKTAEPGDQIEVPVTVTYEDGSKDITSAVINVVDVPEREIPFKVEYKYDDTVPAGTYKVETEGKPGAETLSADGTWTRIVDPVNEVVVVGTKPAESAKDVTWTVPIPFPTEVRENPDLAPGETRVVQEGENGEKTYTAKFTAQGDKAEVAEAETTKAPKPRIIEYGPRLGTDELVTKTEKPIPFETEVVFDSTLEEGQQVVDQKGELGTEVTTSTQKLVDGKPDGDPIVTTERTKEPVKQIIRVGTKTTGTKTSEYEVDVPFETEIIFDDTMEAGTQETVQEGKLGKDKVTTTDTIENSQVVDTKTERERVTDPVNKIIKVGTKGEPASTKVEWTEKTPFEVEVRVNPELKPGETKVIQEGKPGEIKHTVTVNVENGEVSKEDSSEKISDPVKQIVEVGPSKTQTTLTDKHTEKTPYETVIEYDPNLEVGKIVEDQPGSYGEKEITKTWQLENGEPVGDPETSEKVIKDPTTRKLRVGTKCLCVDPTEPTDPTEPAEPTDPTQPTDPTEPTDPTDPTQPTEPTDPTDPTQPTDPTDPTDPSEPTQPSETTPGTTAGTMPSDKVTTPSTEGSKSAESGAQSGSSLARTGVSVGGSLAAAAALLLAGAGFTTMRRRNSQR